MDAFLLLLLDSRAPMGGHHHSGGMEPAVTAGRVQTPADVEHLCHLRLRTTGLVGASFAAAAALAWQAGEGAEHWALLDAELDARMPSPALRAASRAQARGLLRLFRAMRPDVDLGVLGAAHHPVVQGVGVAVGGGGVGLAARAAALAACSAPAQAAVRLLGLDPLATHAMLADFSHDIDLVADAGAQAARSRAPRDLPADGAPTLDLSAEAHLTTEVRLFAS